MTSTARVSGKTRKSQAVSYKMYIDARFVDAQGGKTFEVYDPATEEAIATVPAGDARDTRPKDGDGVVGPRRVQRGDDHAAIELHLRGRGKRAPRSDLLPA